jgi:hypothetical protein
VSVRHADDERTTGELIEALGEDVNRSHEALLKVIDAGTLEKNGSIAAEYEFEARQLIRAIFAYIEAVTFSVKVSCVHQCMEAGIEVSDYERQLAVEVAGELTDGGEIVERPAKLRLAQNVRFAFKLLEKSTGKPTTFNPADHWWSCFKAAIRVRDRLMHPRFPEDIDISGADIVNALKARDGFTSVLIGDEDDA